MTLSANARLIPPLCGDSAVLDLSTRPELELKSVPDAHLANIRSEHQACSASQATLLAALCSAKEDLFILILVDEFCCQVKALISSNAADAVPLSLHLGYRTTSLYRAGLTLKLCQQIDG